MICKLCGKEIGQGNGTASVCPCCVVPEATLTLWHAAIPGEGTAEDSIRMEYDPPPPHGTTEPRFRTLETGDQSMPDFKLGKRLGSGGMGVVYAANQTAFNREVAIKMVKPGRKACVAAADALMAEAVVTGHLEHPNVVPVYDLGVDAEGTLFYAMKEVQGFSWAQLMAEKTQDENLDIFLRVADTIAFAHSRGVLHRDLKPHNIMLGEFGEVMVMDWGASCAVCGAVEIGAMSAESSFCGTPAYMPPEMARGDTNRLGVTSDVYLLGAMLYQIVAGHPPRIEKDPVLCLSLASENVIEPVPADGELLRIAQKAMATAPADRFPDVRTLQAAIRDYRSHSESLALLENARMNLSRARQERDYDLFSRAIYGFREALDLWPENPDAEPLRVEASLEYARCAFGNHDFELAQSLLDPADPVHRELRGLIFRAIRERDAHKRRNRHLLFTARLLILFLLLLFAGAFFMIRAEQKKTAGQHRQSLINLIAARYGEQNYEAAMAAFWELHDQYGLDVLAPDALLDVRVAAAMNPYRGAIDSGIGKPLGFVRSREQNSIWVAGRDRLVRMRFLRNTGYDPDTMVAVHDYTFGRYRPSASAAERVALPFSVSGSSAVFEGADGTLWAGSGTVLYRRVSGEWTPVLDVSRLDFPLLPESYAVDRAAIEKWMDETGRRQPISGVVLNEAQTRAALALGPNVVGWFDLGNLQCLGWYAVNYRTFSALFPGHREVSGESVAVGNTLKGMTHVGLELSPDESQLIYHSQVMNASMVFSFSLPRLVRNEYTYNRDYPVRATGFAQSGGKYYVVGQNGILYAPDDRFVEQFKPELFYLAKGSKNGNRWDPFRCLVRRLGNNDLVAAALSPDGHSCATLSEDGVLYAGATAGDRGFHAAFRGIDRQPAGLYLSNDRSVILLDDAGALHFYNLRDHSVAALPFPEKLHTLSRGNRPHNVVLSTSNSVYLAEIKPDGAVEPELLLEIPHDSVAYDPLGRYLALVCGNRGRVFNLETKEEELTFQSSWSFGSYDIHFDESGRHLYYGGGWRPGMRLYETGSWSNLISITYQNAKQAHFTDVAMDFSFDEPRLLATCGGPKRLESRSVDPLTLQVKTNWISHAASAPMAVIPFYDPVTGRRMIWCKLWFQNFQLYDAETGEASVFQNHWTRSGLGHPESIASDARVVFPMENGQLQIALKSDLYPVFDRRILGFEVDRAVLSTDASSLFLLTKAGDLCCLDIPEE